MSPRSTLDTLSAHTSNMPTFLGHRRRLILVFLAVMSALSFISMHVSRYSMVSPQPVGLKMSIDELPEEEKPPSYTRLREWEWNLPQHDLDLPFPEGRTGRYVKFTNAVKFLGWNNVLNEVLMNTQLAYESKRAYVFIDYFWKPSYWHFRSIYDRVDIQPATPLNAIISGPTAGGSWDPEDPAPRSIHEKWFDVVCPEEERRLIYTADVKPAVSDAPGQVLFDHWKDLLLNAPERCIEVVASPDDSYPQTFDLWLWGSYRVIDMWERFSKSPVTRLLRPSSIVKSAVDRNEYLFTPRGPRPAHPASLDPFERMMAVHIRRGDFKEACISLATWNSTFYSWNLLPQLPDVFTPPPGGAWGKNTPENEAEYMKHCLPSPADIVHKAHQARIEYIEAKRAETGRTETLDVLYVLTNEPATSQWLKEIKAMFELDEWNNIVTTPELDFDKQQLDVDMAVDMELASRAAIFLGNGWSSFTSNIVHSRLAIHGKIPLSCRFY